MVLDLDGLARRAGRYCWIERRAFEVLGAWVPTIPEPEVKVTVAAQAHHHAWHAQLWRERMPEVPLDPDGVTDAVEGELGAFVDALGAPAAPEQTIEKLVGVHRVLLPRMVALYTAHLRSAAAVADGPTIRALRLVIQDEIDDWREGERLVQSLLVTAADVERAASHHAHLEGLLVAAGGMAGPDAGRASPLSDGGPEWVGCGP